MRSIEQARNVVSSAFGDVSANSKSGLSFMLHRSRNDHFEIHHPRDSEHWQSPYLGGIGVTSRELKNITWEANGLRELMDGTQGKIVFLGNGLSDFPMKAVGMYTSGALSHPPVIVDLFDYAAMEEDLRSLAEILQQKDVAPIQLLTDRIATVQTLNHAIRSGNLIAVNHRIGSGDVPSELLDANLAVNIFGPSELAINEQLGLLAKGGRLYFTNVNNYFLQNAELPDGFFVEVQSNLRLILARFSE